uniref:Uncharacterized protein n=1 Tax=Trichobilharzia regenti TaxID=157069 RepID=A0AA85JXQ2_TRIRE|nr:unnamed protein product [Trichobilharzia regenti]
MSSLTSNVCATIRKHIPLIKFRSQLKNAIGKSVDTNVHASTSTFVVKSSVPREAAVELSAINPKFRRKMMTEEEVAFYERGFFCD